MRIGMMCALAMVAGTPLAALDVEQSEFKYSSELLADGYAPIAASAANAVYGLYKGNEIYLCFVADNINNQNIRQTRLLAEIDGQAVDRTLPNIPVVCLLTQ